MAVLKIFACIISHRCPIARLRCVTVVLQIVCIMLVQAVALHWAQFEWTMKSVNVNVEAHTNGYIPPCNVVIIISNENLNLNCSTPFSQSSAISNIRPFPEILRNYSQIIYLLIFYWNIEKHIERSKRFWEVETC